VSDLIELGGKGGVELGHAVAESRHPERRNRIEVVASVRIYQLASLGALDDQRLVQGEGRHLGEAVPDAGLIALDPIVHNRQRIGAVR